MKTIFDAMFLERKLILNFLTYSKILEETSKIACLLLALLRLRIVVIQKQDQSQNSSMNFTDMIDSTRGVDTALLSEKLGAAASERGNPNQLRKNSHVID